MGGLGLGAGVEIFGGSDITLSVRLVYWGEIF